MFKAILAFNFVGIGFFKAYSQFRNVVQDVVQILIFFFGTVGILFGGLNFVQPPVWTVTGGCIVMFKAILAFNFVGIGFFKAYSQFRNVVQDVVQILIFFLGPWGYCLGS